MRVLVVSHAYPVREGSSHGIFIHRLNLGLLKLGVDVQLLHLLEWTPPWPVTKLWHKWDADRVAQRSLRASLDGVPIHYPAAFTPRPSRFFPGDQLERERRALVRYVARDRRLTDADIVLGHFMIPDGSRALALGRSLGLPVASMAWGDDLHGWPDRSVTARKRLREVLEDVDVPIACSARMASDGNAWLARPRDDWEVVYAGVDLEQFAPVSDPRPYRARVFSDRPRLLEPGIQILLMIGTPVAAKGYRELLEAWATVAPVSPDWHLVMAGGGTTEIDVAREITARRLERSAHWIGAQPAELMSDLMRAANGFVLPSHNEGLSISVLEALACGVATITTDVGGHAEVIRTSADGWLVPPRDVHALERALCELMSEPAERERRAAGGRRAAERIGSPTDNARRLATLLEHAVAHRRAQCAV